MTDNREKSLADAAGRPMQINKYLENDLKPRREAR